MKRGLYNFLALLLIGTACGDAVPTRMVVRCVFVWVGIALFKLGGGLE